jgi:hypothetical protein
MIYQDFFEDDYFGTKDYGMRLLWIGLIAAAADDQGRILDNAYLIKSKVFMYDDTPADEIDSWLCSLDNDGKIIRYVVGKKRLIQITKWWDYQTPSWASESKYPPPPNWIDRVKCHISGNEIKKVNWDKDGGLHSQQGSQLHSQPDSALNDVKLRRDNDDDENESDDDPIKAILQDFTTITGIPLPFNTSTYAKWKTEASDWVRLGVTREGIRLAFDKATEKGYTVSRPHSLTNFIRGEIAKAQGGAEKSNEELIKEWIENGTI